MKAEPTDASFRVWFIDEAGIARAVGEWADDLSAGGRVVGVGAGETGRFNFSMLGDDITSHVDDSIIGTDKSARSPAIRGNIAAGTAIRQMSQSVFAALSYFATVGQSVVSATCEVQTTSLPRFSSATISEDAHVLWAMTDADGSGPTEWTVIRAPLEGPCARVGKVGLLQSERVLDLAPRDDGSVLLLIERLWSEEQSGRVLSMSEAGAVSEVAKPFHSAWGSPTFIKTHLDTVYIGFDGNPDITLTRLDEDLHPLTSCLAWVTTGLGVEP